MAQVLDRVTRLVWLAGDVQPANDEWTLDERVAIAVARGLDFVVADHAATPTESTAVLTVPALPLDEVAVWTPGSPLPTPDRPLVAVAGARTRRLGATHGVGQPTTWVQVAEVTAAAVADAVAQGRTFVAAQPPAFGGPRVYLQVTGGGATVRVERGAGTELELTLDGEPVHRSIIVNPVATHEVELTEPGWVRAELRAPAGDLWAATSPVRIGGRSRPAT